jgi:hypothetical protein
MKYLTLLLLLCTPSAHAAELGEIVSISKSGIIRFYSGEYMLKVGDSLRVKNDGDTNAHVEVVRLDPPYTEARIRSLQIHPYGALVPLQVGQIVKLGVSQWELNEFSFFVGPNHAKANGSFGETNYFLGISFLGYFKPAWVWQFQVQADSLGKDPSETEIRRASYLLGSGYEWQQFQLIGNIGLIDTMTITKNSSPTYIDPYTGVPISQNNVQHKTKAGFLILLNRRFELSQVSSTSNIGWSITPRVSYANTFSSTPYGGFWSYGLSVDAWFD